MAIDNLQIESRPKPSDIEKALAFLGINKVEVRIRTLERIDVGGVDCPYSTMIVNGAHIYPDYCPEIPKGESILSEMRSGDSFLQVIRDGKTVLVYGPLQKGILYLDGK